ncbi:alpha/beta hydrolase [Falsigemmobacter intermedius]|uniref:alpha/beta hydrolase n=1 Tax=Falsigemmobacter intermedius TaxID=1553448 RepID=UPI003F0F2BCB
MRRLLRMLFASLALFVLLMVALALWPRDRSLSLPAVDEAAILRDPAAYLATREAAFPDIIPGTQKRILWHGAPGEKTPLSVIYLHGFTASSEETRPVPDEVAKALGANLFFTRFAGHGRGAAAMAEPSAEDWMADLAEALSVGAAIGERVLVIATSQGASVLTAGLGTPGPREALPFADRIAGVVMIAPNFRLADPLRAFASDLPGAGVIMPLLIGDTIRAEVRSPEHEKFWNTSYPTRSALPMARLLRAARAAETQAIDLPLLLLRSPQDKVVSNAATDKVIGPWKGPVERVEFPKVPGMDAGAHVIAGRIRSPGMTEAVVAAITRWAGQHLN